MRASPSTFNKHHWVATGNISRKRKATNGGKDGSSCDAMSCISSGDATSSVKGSEVDQEALAAEQIMYYPVNTVYGYYYPGRPRSACRTLKLLASLTWILTTLILTITLKKVGIIPTAA